MSEHPFFFRPDNNLWFGCYHILCTHLPADGRLGGYQGDVFLLTYLFPQFRLADNSESIPFIEYLIRVTQGARNCESTKVIQTWYLLSRNIGNGGKKEVKEIASTDSSPCTRNFAQSLHVLLMASLRGRYCNICFTVRKGSLANFQ